MEKWLHKQADDGSTELDVTEIAGMNINGRLYREGITYRPAQSDAPVDKEFKYDMIFGKLYFAYAFDGQENLDIPYEAD